MTETDQLNIEDCPVCEETFIPEETPGATKSKGGIQVCSETCARQISDVEAKQAKEKEKYAVWYDSQTGMLSIENGAEQATQNTKSGLISKTRNKLTEKYNHSWRDRFWNGNKPKQKVGTVVASHDGYLDHITVE